VAITAPSIQASSGTFNIKRSNDGTNALQVLTTGEVIIGANYLYVTASAGAYFSNAVRFRGTISNDTGTNVTFGQPINVTGAIKVGSTEVIDASRNLNNVVTATVNSLHVKGNLDTGYSTPGSMTGGLSLWGAGATTSQMMFKPIGSGSLGNHGFCTDSYNTYFVMDTTNRGWVFRNASTATNVASISNTGGIAGVTVRASNAFQIGTTTVIDASRNLTNIVALNSAGFWTTTSGTSHWGSGDGTGGTVYGTLTWDTGYASIYGASGAELRLGSSGGQDKLTIKTDGNVTINGGALQMSDTTVIDASRNLTNIGTISSGNISSGSIIGTTITSVSAIGAADNVRSGLTHDDSSSMNIGVGGQLVLGYKYTSAGAYTEGAIIKMYKENAVSGQYGSGLKFQVRNHAANLSTKMTLDPSGNLAITGTVTASSSINLTAGTLQLRNDVALDHDGASLYIKAPSVIYLFPGNTNKGNISAAGLLTLQGYAINGTTVIDASRNLTNIGTISSGNLTANGSLFGKGFRSGGRGELHLNSSAANTVSEMFFGYGDGFTEANIRWGISDRGTTDDRLVIYKGPAHGGFTEVASFDASEQTLSVASGYKIGTTTVIDASRNLSNIADITVAGTATFNSNIYGKSVNGQYSNLYRFGGLYLTWDSDSYGTNFQHSLTSSDGGSYGDHITLNSYGNVRINFDSNANGTNYFRIGAGSTGTGGVKLTLDESGNGTFAGNVTAYSDIRLKENIVDVDNALNKVCSLRGVYYNMIADETKSRRLGLVAQEVEKVLPEVVIEAHPEDDKDSVLSVDYGNIVALLIEGIKDQQKEIEYMKSEIKHLQENNNGNN
jgi:hypothetical protein